MKKWILALAAALLLCVPLSGLCEVSPFPWCNINADQNEITISLGQTPDSGYSWRYTIEKPELFTVSSEVDEVADDDGSGIKELFTMTLKAAEGQNGKSRVWFELCAMGSKKPKDERMIEVTVSEEGTLGSEQPAKTLKARTVPLYYVLPVPLSEMTLYFADEKEQIPYVSMDTLSAMYNLTEMSGVGLSMTGEQDEEVFVLIRENGSSVMFDFAKGEVTWDDYNMFFSSPYAQNGLDVVYSTGIDEEGRPAYFSRSSSPFIRKGQGISIDFNLFDIDLYYENGIGFLPLQTVCDLFTVHNDMLLLYNGEALFIARVDELNPMTKEIYYEVAPSERSPELAEFNYNELCLALQVNYGLKEAHKAPSFDTLFQQTGLDMRLKSLDPIEANAALADLTFGYLGDLHSGFVAPSPYAGSTASVQSTIVSPSMYSSTANQSLYASARQEYYPDGVPGYEEVGNTAYVTFDSFDYFTDDVDHYETAPTADIADTIGLIAYAHSQITRKDSPVENVVMDLSNNGGGAADCAVFTIAWYLGRCTLSMEDTLTEAQGSIDYKADVNLDRIFDDKDSVSNKRLFCLISPNSFSCGNLVPSAFKESGLVTLLGRRSGGGACVVQTLSTADGSIIQVSGNKRLSVVSNGSYYDVDQGVEPDFIISNIKNFYDRVALTDYINSLY